MDIKKILKNFLIIIFSAFFVYLIIFFILFLINNGDLNKKNIKNSNLDDNLKNDQNINQFVVADKKGIELNSFYTSSFSPKFGNKDAKIHVIMFFDFDCPFCNQEYFDLKRIMNKYKDIAYFEFRNMPLETLHYNATNLANVAMCSDSQGKFWEMFDELFINYDSRQSTNESNMDNLFINYAKNVGLDIKKFSDCYSKKTFNNIVAKDYMDGYDFGVNSTPTFFINGKKVAGVIDYKTWEQIFSSIEKNK